ncbi:uncharacterized protein isoform X1 [Choristoneura fumiferana]|uniref:uncharacterized protein isoform X1 n=1 Tax=Choristoneura fumiferana TaxID=7141 RepID=UPI003D15E363
MLIKIIRYGIKLNCRQIKHVVSTCIASILLTGIVTVNSYVLFSANLDDFHKLAQKFVPDNLAMKLTELVSESSIDKRHDRDGRGQRKTTTDSDTPWNISNINYYFERTERNEVQTNRVKTTQTTTESIFEPDRMHEKDYDRLEDVTFPQIMGKRYKTVQRMATTKEWFEEPPSFLRTIYPKNDDPKLPSHSIYYKDKDSNDRVKPNSPEKDVNDYERNKEQENSNIGREESNNGKQMMQYFPVENKPSQYKKQTKNETDKVRVNGRDISKIKQRKIRKLDNKGKDDSMIFDTIIMSKKKDSYEDYITPKKDDDYLISDGIGSNKKRPSSSTQRDTNDEISLTSKSWQMLSVYRNTERGHRITSFTKKEPNRSILKESIHGIASTIREQPNLSAERDVSDRISPTTRKRPTWSEQKNVYDGSPETRRPSIFSIQRERTEKPITTTQETFPDYIEREWMTTERKKSPTENEWMATDRYTTEKEKKTEDYVLEDKRNDKLQPFDNVPVYEKDPIQARTESLLFNSKELEDQSNNTRYTMKGTGIPTREYYKMSTPDYYKKLPRIVEKYDFNEPIPEADREREKIDDRFAQEPARVNHKVRQQREKTGRSEKQPRQKDSTIQKRNQDKAGPIETILENIGFHFKAIADVTEYANA